MQLSLALCRIGIYTVRKCPDAAFLLFDGSRGVLCCVCTSKRNTTGSKSGAVDRDSVRATVMAAFLFVGLLKENMPCFFTW